MRNFIELESEMNGSTLIDVNSIVAVGHYKKLLVDLHLSSGTIFTIKKKSENYQYLIDALPGEFKRVLEE